MKIAICLMASVLASCVLLPSRDSTDDIPVVKDFDLSRYVGTWYEIARLPQSFERDLNQVTATYSFEEGRLNITNRGIRNGREKISTAVGNFAGSINEGAFRISFFRPFYGDYRIIWLSNDYDLALVTSSTRESLWILSRTPTLAPHRLKPLLDFAESHGFDTTKLEYPTH